MRPSLTFLAPFSLALGSTIAHALPIEPQDERIADVIERHEDYTTEVLKNELKSGRLSESQSSSALEISFLDSYSAFLFDNSTEHFSKQTNEESSVPYLEDMNIEAPSQLNLVINSMSKVGQNIVAAKDSEQ